MTSLLESFNLIPKTEKKIFKINLFDFVFTLLTEAYSMSVVLLAFYNLFYYLFCNCLKREKKAFKISVVFDSGLKSHLLLDKYNSSNAVSMQAPRDKFSKLSYA